MDNELQALRNIDRVDPSPFLYTRILQSIKEQSEHVPGRWVMAGAGTMLVILFLNFITVRHDSHSEKKDLLKAFNLNTQNMLYHE